jgi:CheY-specific phosphatase CheX
MSVSVSVSDGPLLDDLRSIADEVWGALLGEEEVLVPRPIPPGAPFDNTGTWSAAVHVSGGWTGTITTELGEAAAVGLTAGMLGLAADEQPSDGDLADAVGELVNMVGGNLKSLVDGPSVLSLPMVAAGRAAYSSEMRELLRVDAVWRGYPVRFTVHVPA